MSILLLYYYSSRCTILVADVFEMVWSNTISLYVPGISTNSVSVVRNLRSIIEVTVVNLCAFMVDVIVYTVVVYSIFGHLQRGPFVGVHYNSYWLVLLLRILLIIVKRSTAVIHFVGLDFVRRPAKFMAQVGTVVDVNPTACWRDDSTWYRVLQ